MTSADVRCELISKVKAVIEKHRMICPGERVVVGVSGGPDSVALLHVLNLLRSEAEFHLVVAHLDHGLRRESVQDAEFTRELSATLGVKIHVQTTSVKQMATELRISVEEAGRRARYDFFERVRLAEGAASIATAHHMDDQLETFFLRVFRGATLTGLGGIPPKRERIIRPFTEIRKTEILHFLSERRISYRLDTSNFSANTDRNFIRNRLIPLISDRFPGFRDPMMRTMTSVRQEEAFLASLAMELKTETTRHLPGRVIFDIPRLCEAPGVLALRVILDSLYCLSGPSVRWTRVHLDTILAVLYGENPSVQIDLPGGIVLFREYDQLTLTSELPGEVVPFSQLVMEPGEIHVTGTDVHMTFEIIEPPIDLSPAAYSPHEAYFDADDASFPLTVRSPRPGDRLGPWGMKGTRKLKEVLIDLKVPRRLRTQIPLLEKDGEILWVPGFRRGRAAPVVPKTHRVLKVTVTTLPPDMAPPGRRSFES